MSSSSQDKRAELRSSLRQFTGIGSSFFRAAAARIGMTVTDMQVLDILESAGPATAGQLADLTGLTTGAITGMLNRLEERGFVSKERDPNDARRVIVQLTQDTDEKRQVSPLFASLGNAWDEIAAQYSDEQIVFLLAFLKQSNAASMREIARLREAPADNEGIYSVPLEGLERGRLVFTSGVSQLTLRADKRIAELYQARFEGSVPGVKAKEGVVTIRYPRRLWMPGGKQRTAEVTLSTAIPWQIVIQGGASEVTAELGDLQLSGLEVRAGASMIHLELPVPAGVVPIRVSGGASEIIIHRPAGVAARAHLTGWISTFAFDEQTFAMGNNVRMQSTDFDRVAPYYDIEIASSASTVTITSG